MWRTLCWWYESKLIPDHSDQGVKAGQGSALQSSVSFLWPSWHADGSRVEPPTSSRHSRTFVLVPPPQDTLQSVQSDQSVHTGQVFSLHSRTSSRGSKQGFSLTPFRGTLQSRTLLCVPPPQDLEQVVQSDHGVNVGQVDSPQFSVISESPGQAVSLLDVFGNRHSRTFLLDPPPQVLEHSVHWVHSVHSGHGLTLQSSVTIRSALHGFPSYVQFYQPILRQMIKKARPFFIKKRIHFI